MPLLLCPNDNTAMQEIERNGVMIDVCPECRGVWLDRGELEKILDMVGRGRSEAPRREEAPRGQHDEPRPDRAHDERRYDQRGYDERGYDAKRRKKRFDIFDFFD